MSTERSLPRTAPPTLSPCVPPKNNRRSRAHKRRAVLALLKDPIWVQRSDGLIAQQANVSQPFVSKLRRELSQNVLSAQPTTRRGADDVLRETRNIGRRPAELSPAHAENLIRQLHDLAAGFPLFREVIEQTLDAITLNLNRSPEENRRLVLNAIHHGAWTIRELIDESGLSRRQLEKILKCLEEAKIIITGERKCSDGGRPERLYLPAPNRP